MKNDTRKKVLHFRVSKQENEMIKSQLPEGEIFSDFARSVLLTGKFTPKRDYKNLVHQIARIGNNLNQIAYTLNHSNVVNKQVDSILLLRELREIRTELLEILK